MKIFSKCDELMKETTHIDNQTIGDGIAEVPPGGGDTPYMSYGDVRTIWVSFLLPKNL